MGNGFLASAALGALVLAGLSGPAGAADKASDPQGPVPAAPDTAPDTSRAGGGGDIVVTARKRNESSATVPIAITAFSDAVIEAKNIQTFDDYATKVPNLSFFYGGGPTGISDARTIAIRGITGQNLAGTAGATGFYIDDTPVPGSLDPRVLDIADIEVLKGPQGTLFGESSLGGNVRLITKKPNLDTNSFSYAADVGATQHGGSADGGINGVGNLVVIAGTLAIRVVGFYDHEAGYLTRTYPTDPTSEATYDPNNTTAPRMSVGNQGANTSYGGWVTTRLRASERLDITARVMAQSSQDNGFPAAFAPLPGFTPDYRLDRAFNVQPTATDRWITPSLDVKYHGQGWDFVSERQAQSGRYRLCRLCPVQQCDGQRHPADRDDAAADGHGEVQAVVLAQYAIERIAYCARFSVCA